MDERPLALPKLYGAPAYRPPRRVAETPRPFDPDDLPIAAERTDEEQEFVATLPARAFEPGGGVILHDPSAQPGDNARDDDTPRGLRGLAGRFLGRN